MADGCTTPANVTDSLHEETNSMAYPRSRAMNRFVANDGSRHGSDLASAGPSAAGRLTGAASMPVSLSHNAKHGSNAGTNSKAKAEDDDGDDDEPKPWPPASTKSTRATENWPPAAAPKGTTAAFPACLDVYIACDYKRLYEKLAVDQIADENPNKPLEPKLRVDGELVDNPHYHPSNSRDTPSAELPPAIATMAQEDLLDAARRRIKAFVEKWLEGLPRECLFPCGAGDATELFPAIYIPARPKLNLNDHHFFPMGTAVRVLAVPRWDPPLATNPGYWCPRTRTADQPVRVYFVPALDRDAAAWTPPTSGAGLPISTWKQEDVPHGEVHKAYLCLSQSNLGITPVFDVLAIEQAFEKLTTEAHLEAPDLVKQMKDEFMGYALRRNAPGLEKAKRGLLLWGPPGTGKSAISVVLAKYIGMAAVGPIMAAGELTSKYKGMVEKTLTVLFSRGHLAPWLTASLFVDEIDSMAPKRSSGASETKVDGLAVILSLYQGPEGKDVPNFFLMGASNRLSEIDEAVQRRMHITFFVGLPSSQAREQLLLSRHLAKHLHLQGDPMLPHLVAVTTNFSGAAMIALLRNAAELHLRKGGLTREDYDALVQKTARKYGITLGGVSLATLLLGKHASGGSAHPSAVHGVLLPPKEAAKGDFSSMLFDLLLAGGGTSKPTGRVVVRLHGPKDLRGWAVQLATTAADGRESTHVQFLPMPDLDMRETLRLVAKFSSRTIRADATDVIAARAAGLPLPGPKSIVEATQVVTGESLAAAGVTDEASAVKHVTGVLETAAEYGTSLVLLDACSVADVQEDESTGGAGDTTSFKVNRWMAFRQLLDAFANKVEYLADVKGRPQLARYIVVVSMDARMTARLTAASDAVWDDAFMREWDSIDTKKRECTNSSCGKKFTVKENGEEECKYHASKKLRMMPIIDSRYKLWRHLMAAYGINVPAGGKITDATKAVDLKARIAKVKQLIGDLCFGLEDDGSIKVTDPPATGAQEALLVVATEESSWVSAETVASSRAEFPPAIYPFLVWACCERPYNPGADGNGCLVGPHNCKGVEELSAEQNLLQIQLKALAAVGTHQVSDEETAWIARTARNFAAAGPIYRSLLTIPEALKPLCELVSREAKHLADFEAAKWAAHAIGTIALDGTLDVVCLTAVLETRYKIPSLLVKLAQRTHWTHHEVAEAALCALANIAAHMDPRVNAGLVHAGAAQAAALAIGYHALAAPGAQERDAVVLPAGLAAEACRLLHYLIATPADVALVGAVGAAAREIVHVGQVADVLGWSRVLLNLLRTHCASSAIVQPALQVICRVAGVPGATGALVAADILTLIHGVWRAHSREVAVSVAVLEAMLAIYGKPPYTDLAINAIEATAQDLLGAIASHGTHLMVAIPAVQLLQVLALRRTNSLASAVWVQNLTRLVLMHAAQQSVVKPVCEVLRWITIAPRGLQALVKGQALDAVAAAFLSKERYGWADEGMLEANLCKVVAALIADASTRAALIMDAMVGRMVAIAERFKIPIASKEAALHALAAFAQHPDARPSVVQARARSMLLSAAPTNGDAASVLDSLVADARYKDFRTRNDY